MKIAEDTGRAPGTATGIRLARRIGGALGSAYKGTLQFHYNKEELLLRVDGRR